MALSYTSIPRFHLHRLQMTTGFLHGSTTNPVRLSELTRGPRRKSQQTSTSAHCLLGVVTASDLQTTPLNDLASSDFASRSMQTITDFISENSLHAPSYTHTILLADLDPATAKLVIGVMGPFLSAFGFLFIVRIVMSWYPKLPVGKFPYVIAYAPTEPILGLTRKLIPPVGGVDVTPVVWFGLISFLNEILVGPQGLLVLLSQQV